MTSHRGLSAVVGTVFLIAVVMGALSYVSYSLDVMGNFSESLIAEESRQSDKQSEAFEISSIDVTIDSKLDGVIKNTGEIPVKITTLWIDEQGVNDIVQKYTLDAEIAPGNTVNINSLVDFTMDSTKGYNMKVVSSRGEVNSFYVNSLANENIYMILTPSSSVIPSTFSTTLMFTVVNNMSNGNYLYNLTPVMNDTKQSLVEGSAGLTFDRLDGPTPLTYDSLGPGEVAIFTYEYELTSETDLDTQLFNVTLANANPGNEALTQVHVKSVPLATESGSSLSSQGLDDSTFALTDVLYFHSLNTLTPNNEYPMDGSSPNSAGLTISPNGNTLEFISANVTVDTTLPIGVFNASLNYFSSPVPLGFPMPNFAVMLDCQDCAKTDSTTEMIGIVKPDKGLKEKAQKPSWVSTGGPDNDAYFNFNSPGGTAEWFESEWDGSKNGAEKDNAGLQAYPDTDAIWVRIPSTFETYQPIIRYGDVADADQNGPKQDRLEISIVNGGQIEYSFDTKKGTRSDPVEDVACTSIGVYDDNQWHHIVAVRDGIHACKLYIDNILVDSDDNGALTDSTLDIKKAYVGAAGKDIQTDLIADVASWIHWDGAALTPTQVEDLYYTNYGNNGTRLHMTIERTNGNGIPIQDIVSEQKIELPFFDPSVNNPSTDTKPWVDLQSGNTTDLKYSQANMTWASSQIISFDAGDRIKLTLDWKNNDEQNLPINIMFDDNSGWVFPAGPSFLQTPQPEPKWPTFLSFSTDAEITYSTFNEGPEGVWFTFAGTRLVLTSADKLSSFGAMPHYVNKTTPALPKNAEMTPDQDSLYVPNGFFAEFEFYRLQSPASILSPPCNECKAVSGDYNAAIYLSGYDENGETFLKTVTLGQVHLTDP